MDCILALLGILAALFRALAELIRAMRQARLIMPSTKDEALTLGQVAKRLGCRRWQVQRLFERELLPDPERIGLFRYVRASQLPAVEKALRKAGYLD